MPVPESTEGIVLAHPVKHPTMVSEFLLEVLSGVKNSPDKSSNKALQYEIASLHFIEVNMDSPPMALVQRRLLFLTDSAFS